MTAQPTDRPPMHVLLDRSVPVAERRRIYREWAQAHATSWHTHPGWRSHGHAGGDRIHEHEVPRR